jgi:hypothetical protein
LWRGKADAIAIEVALAAEPAKPSTVADNRDTWASLPFGGEDAAGPAGGTPAFRPWISLA